MRHQQVQVINPPWVEYLHSLGHERELTRVVMDNFVHGNTRNFSLPPELSDVVDFFECGSRSRPEDVPRDAKEFFEALGPHYAAGYMQANKKLLPFPRHARQAYLAAKDVARSN